MFPGIPFLRRAAVLALLASAHGRPLPPERAAALAAEAATAVAAVLAAEPASAVRLLGASLDDERLTLDFSRDLLEFAPGSAAFERFSRPVHLAAAAVLQDSFAHFEIHTRIAGVPLPAWLDATDTATRQRPLQTPLAPAPGAPQALGSRRIALSPGHGYYLNGANWVLQRGYWQGIVEDFVNHEMITLVRDELAGAGATVIPTRNLDRTAGTGESGFPKWQEAARYHVKAMGADTSVWNEAGFTHLEQDIRCRPRYANAVGAEILISLHNNGGGGTGTETLYDTNNGFGPESRRLAEAVHNRVIATLRREYNPAWPDRRVQGFNGSYGENRLATRPSILIEVAFMDRPTPDNAALQDEAFKRLVARAIREGTQEYFDGPAGVPPFGPTALLATTTPTTVSLAWTDQSANETGFRIERRAEGAATWETLGTVGANVATYLDSLAAAGRSYTYRVASYNAAGSSAQYSNEATLGPVPAAPATSPAAPAAWLANVSLRTALGAAQTVAVGFVVAGGPREVLVRAAGPTLTQFGLGTAMIDPRLALFRDSARVTDNNDWPAALAPAMAALGAFPFATASRDAALFRAIEGAHTVLATGTTAGTLLVEAYDLGGGGTGRIVNLSARHRVGTGADVLIAGFFLAGTGEKRVLIRAVGPTLASFGVTGALADPRIEVFEGTRSIATNDNWDAGLAPTFASVAAFALPAGSRDAALVLNLSAGRGYTAQVAGAGTSTGEALVEVYELP